MILESIELRHVGPFRRAASIGPITTGISVLAAPNERGKSTIIRAAARALFDKHTCGDDEIRALRPAGTDLPPAVTVVLEIAGVRYRVQKRFLSKPSSELSEWRGGEWQLLDTEDKADERLQKLLQSAVPGRGATKAAHWGMLGYLWARQGEPCDWPAWSGPAGEQIQSRLAKVEIDPVIQKLKDSLWQDYLESFTPGGKPKKNGELERLETAWSKTGDELRAVQEKLAALVDLERQFAELTPKVAQLEAEVQERGTEAAALQEQARQAEALQNELHARQNDFERAKEKLEAVAADMEKLKAHRSTLEGVSQALGAAERSRAAAVEAEAAAKQRVESAQHALDGATRDLAQLHSCAQRTGDLLKLHRLDSDSRAAQAQSKKAAAQSQTIGALKKHLDGLPDIPPAKLKKLQELDQRIRANEARLEALGLSIELTAENSAEIEFLRDGERHVIPLKAQESHTVHAAQAAGLRLPGWGALRVRSGATELHDLQRRLDEDRDSLRGDLVRLGAVSVADTEQKLSRRKELQKDFDTAAGKLRELLDGCESLERLEAHAAQLAAQANALRAALSPDAAESGKSVVELDSESERVAVSVREQQRIQDAADGALKECRRAAGQADEARQRAEKEHTALAGKVSALEQQTKALLERYDHSIDDAKKAAQSAFVGAEARRDETRARLPAEFEKLPERNRRAAAAHEETKNDLERLRRNLNLIEGSLQTLGAEGLYSMESALLERQEVLRPQLERLRVSGTAARLVHDLIDYRKQAATRAVLAPLESRLSDAFAEVTRDFERRVFLDEHLKVRGIGPNENALIAYENLSQGAREQLLLCLRLAVASEVAGAGHQLLILDDVLVNTDSQRQERVLDLLQSAAGKLQILILTCHPERYRGTGTVVEIIQLDS
jgi:DNA repair exonuclease SbcCD ATPase subunit